MKSQLSVILILIACILTGCGKSMEDVAGVYEAAEIKEPFNTRMYDSTTWVLDLAELGTFTLTEEKFRKFSESKKYAPVPKDGRKILGEWELDRDSIICRWSEFHAPEIDISSFDADAYLNEQEQPRSGGEVHYSLIFDVQTSGDVVSGSVEGGTLAEHEGFKPILVSPVDGIAKTRFKRVE